MIKDKLMVRGDVFIEKTNTQTNEKENFEFRNLVVDAGLEYMLYSLVDNAGDRPGPIVAMAVGTNGVAAANGDTALGAEIWRNQLTTKSVDGPTNSIQFQTTFEPNQPNQANTAITEAGIFNLYTDNTTTGGTMLCRTAFPAINKADVDQLTINWVITLALAP